MSRTTAGAGYTTSQRGFSRVPSATIQRSVFNRSHSHRTTFSSGYLVPVFVDEALPGDTFALNMNSFARMATPIYPIMDNLYMEFFFFAVPNRLLWDNWERMNGAQDDPGDSTSFDVPIMNSSADAAGSYQELSIHDYFGLPTKVANVENNALWHRAYNFIWNEWFRDENLQDSLLYGNAANRDDGPDDPDTYPLQRRGKRHDYFTSCLPWPQKGTEVLLPLGVSAPVTGTAPVIDGGGSGPTFLHGANTGGIQGQPSAQTGRLEHMNPPVSGINQLSWVDPDLDTDADDVASTLAADLTGATAATINELREAFQIQRIFERDARGGTRYTEILRSHFQVVSPDSRLQRPEYLGGARTMLNVNPVASTADLSGAGGQFVGELAAFVTGSTGGRCFVKSFVEHCTLIGLVNVRAELSYQQGLERMFSRTERFDYYWPAFAHLGEQAVLNQEIFAQGTSADTEVFGYQERYAEYRYKPSRVTGRFRSNASQSLDAWHLSQDFAALPVLDDTFIEDDPPMDRVIAVATEPEFIMDCWFQYRCARPMPTYSVPGLIDHF